MLNRELKIGTGRVEIKLPDGFFPSEGFFGIHDDLFVRTVLLVSGSKSIVFITIDLTSLGTDVVTQIKEMISGTHRVEPEGIIVSASHTFQTPHIKPGEADLPADAAGRNRMLKAAVFSAVQDSAGAAFSNIRPGRIGFGTGYCDVNVNRDVETKSGWWKGSNPDGLSDKTLTVFRFESADGTPLAFIMNYAVQSCILLDSVPSDGRLLASSDLCGAAACFVEKEFDNSIVALWSTGAAGDQNPVMTANRFVTDKERDYSRIDIGDAGYALVELLGERLGKEVIRTGCSIENYKAEASVKAAGRTVILPGQKIFPDIHNMKPAMHYEFEEGPPMEVAVNILIINNIALVGVAPELVCRTALQIKEASPYKNTIIMTMVNGAQKYLPDMESYERITYASMNSMGARGSAEILRDEIITLLNETVLLPAY